MAVTKKYISVFVPTYNGGPYIRDLIEGVLAQELPKGYTLEFLITDSGSKDDTVSIVKSYENRISLTEIPNSEYGHGKTRQKAAERSKGDFILFLSQDATPAHERWIINMIEPFFVSEKVGAVFGRQIPRPFAPPTIKREVASVFGGIGAPDSIILHRDKSLVDKKETNALNSFFSDVNSAVRKDIITKIPFRDVKYAEDQALAIDLQNAGYLKAYSPTGAVWHSNEYTAREYYHRKFDEYLGLINSTDSTFEKSFRSLLLGWIKPTIDDIKFAIKDAEYNKRAKIKFVVQSPVYNFNMQKGKYDAIKYQDNSAMKTRLSLEEKRKND